MKKLMILTAIVMLTSSSVGCRACRWLWRGDAYDASAPICAPVCPPACPPAMECDPCATPGLQPGPADYSPVMGQ